MPTPLQSFESGGDDLPLFMARSWAESTSSALREARRLRRRFVVLDRQHERMDGDGLTWDGVMSAFSAAWTAECLLIVSASQFEHWLGKLYAARGREAPATLPYLRELRNAIVHLDEAVIDEESWTARPGSRMSERHGIGALPGGELPIWLNGEENVLGVISADALDAYVDSLLDELWEELDDFARDWLELVRSGR